MMKYPRTITTLAFLFLMILFSGWGSVGHRKINQHAPSSFPHSFQFLKTSWSILLADHASDADDRKDWDPDEKPKHYIDIDDYPEFVQNGKIPQTYDSVVALHGQSFVLDKGTLPWATLIAFDSLKNCFQRMDWNKAGLFAADLGHYVADGHMPLHITRNYNGQYSGQTGIHLRYESSMISKYNTQIIYPDDSVAIIPDISSTVFTYLYYNYKLVDSVLYADKMADSIAGGTSGTTYYAELWNHSHGFTIELFRKASYTLAGLIYTAWVQAGSPVIPANAIDELSSGNSFHLQSYPNPSSGDTKIRFMLRNPGSHIQLQIYYMDGTLATTLSDDKMVHGMNEIRWDARGFKPGIYFIQLRTDEGTETIKTVLFH